MHVYQRLRWSLFLCHIFILRRALKIVSLFCPQEVSCLPEKKDILFSVTRASQGLYVWSWCPCVYIVHVCLVLVSMCVYCTRVSGLGVHVCILYMCVWSWCPCVYIVHVCLVLVSGLPTATVMLLLPRQVLRSIY